MEVITVPLDGESADEHIREALAEAAGQQASEVGQATTWSLDTDTRPGFYTSTPVGWLEAWMVLDSHEMSNCRSGAAKMTFQCAVNYILQPRLRSLRCGRSRSERQG